jgi:hypothetical protein
VSKEAPDAAFTCAVGWKKAKAEHVGSACVIGLIARDQLLREVGIELACT